MALKNDRVSKLVNKWLLSLYNPRYYSLIFLKSYKRGGVEKVSKGCRKGDGGVEISNHLFTILYIYVAVLW